MKHLEANMFLELSLWTWSLVLWTLSVPDLTAKYSVLIILFLVKAVLVIIGLKDIILKEQNLLIRCLMLYAKKLNRVIVCKGSS
uniref:Putative secreted protein n=1 Tax=Xenopsylla cheopis TaxID=163159 RepID=A0A6M2DVZ9_XENCH